MHNLTFYIQFFTTPLSFEVSNSRQQTTSMAQRVTKWALCEVMRNPEFIYSLSPINLALLGVQIPSSWQTFSTSVKTHQIFPHCKTSRLKHVNWHFNKSKQCRGIFQQSRKKKLNIFFVLKVLGAKTSLGAKEFEYHDCIICSYHCKCQDWRGKWLKMHQQD